MKKRLFALCLAAAMAAALSACAEKGAAGDAAAVPEDTKKEAKEEPAEDVLPEMEKVVLNEVAHSIFYAPMYVAVEEGYFEEEGIALELVTGFGARNLVQDKS